MLWSIVLSFLATGVVADTVTLFNPNPGVPLEAYEAGVRFPIPTNTERNMEETNEGKWKRNESGKLMRCIGYKWSHDISSRMRQISERDGRMRFHGAHNAG